MIEKSSKQKGCKNLENACSKCGMPGSGYKCDMCGAESDHRPYDHLCGVAHCVAKCSGCGEAQTYCTC